MPKKKRPTTATPTSPQMAKSVDEHIALLDDWRGDIIQELRKLIKSTLPKIEEHFRWGQPVYEFHGPVCFIKVYRNQVNFGFWRGAQIPDPKQVFAPSVDQMRSVKLTDVGQIHPTLFRDLIKSAARLNKEWGDPTGQPVAHFYLSGKAAH